MARGLRRGSAADCLLGLRVRIPPGAWMFVSCVMYSEGQKAKPGQRSIDKVQKTGKNPARGRGGRDVGVGCY